MLQICIIKIFIIPPSPQKDNSKVVKEPKKDHIGGGNENDFNLWRVKWSNTVIVI